MDSVITVNDLFNSALEGGSLSPDSLDVLKGANMGVAIQQNLGKSVDSIESTDPFLLAILVDDSGSIRFGGNTQFVRDGHNLIIESMKDSKMDDGILAHCRYLNEDKPLYEFVPIEDAVMMDSKNYNPNGGTPLRDRMIEILGTVLAKQQEFVSQMSVLPRTVTVIITDGDDIGSSHRVDDVKKLVKDLLRQEVNIVAAMGIDDGQTDFRSIFSEMGIQDEWILTPKNTPADIRKAFGRLSKSAVKASQSSGQSFSQMAIGGFGN